MDFIKCIENLRNKKDELLINDKQINELKRFDDISQLLQNHGYKIQKKDINTIEIFCNCLFKFAFSSKFNYIHNNIIKLYSKIYLELINYQKYFQIILIGKIK